MSENEYTISQVSNITGVSTSAINYYVRLNIIEPPKKTAKTRSSFSNLHIEKSMRSKNYKIMVSL